MSKSLVGLENVVGVFSFPSGRVLNVFGNPQLWQGDILFGWPHTLLLRHILVPSRPPRTPRPNHPPFIHPLLGRVPQGLRLVLRYPHPRVVNIESNKTIVIKIKDFILTLSLIYNK